MEIDLTPIQRALLGTFIRAMRRGLPPPTYRELCTRFGWSSTATARDHLRALERKGVLVRSPRRARSYRLADDRIATSVPVVGTVPAGRPTLAVERQRATIRVPRKWSSEATFALTVTGDSMIGAGILDGDQIVVRRDLQVHNNDIVVALIGDEATVKRVRLSKARKPRLVPANPNYADICIDETVSIVGKVVGVIRNLEPRTTRRGEQHG